MRSSLAVGLGLVSTAALGAQEVLWMRQGVVDVTQLGGLVAVVGDLDGDGFEDVVNLAYSNVVYPESRSQVWSISGRDGSTLRVRRGYTEPDRFFSVAAAGDVDGDGIRDYAVGVDVQSAGLFARVEVCSGRDDRILWSVQARFGIEYGFALLGDLDLDGDRRPDLVVAARHEGTGGAVYAYDNGGRLLYKITGSWPGVGIGHSLATVGDVDGDFRDDFVTGGVETFGRGVARLVSGATGNTLRDAYGALVGDDIGRTVTGCGDLDADGVPDFAVGSGNPGQIRPTVQAFSGATAKLLWDARGSGDAFGWIIAGGIDVDLDGVPDVVAGAPGQIAVIHVLSGRDGSRILRWVKDPQLSLSIGLYLAVFGPQPGSPFPGFVAPEPLWKIGGSVLPWQGRIHMVRGNPSGVSAFGAACQGGNAGAPRIGFRDLGAQGVRVHLSEAPPAASAFLLLGFSRTSWGGHPLPLRLDPLGLVGCELYTSLDVVAPVITGTVGLDRGYASVDIPLPLGALRSPLSLHGQWLVLSGRSRSLSGAMRWTH